MQAAAIYVYVCVWERERQGEREKQTEWDTGRNGLTSTAPRALWRWVFKALLPLVGQEIAISFHALVHFVTDDVDETFKHLFYIDVVFCAGFKELKTWGSQKHDFTTRALRKHRKVHPKCFKDVLNMLLLIPSSSASRWPSSVGTSLSSSRSHLLPTRITWALSHEYVLICVAL